MPINSQIDSSLGVVFSEFQDVVTKEDILAQVESFKNDPAFQPSFNHLIDTRGTKMAMIMRSIAPGKFKMY